MHITLTPPGDRTHDFLIQSRALYYHDTPPSWIHKTLKRAIIAQAKRSRKRSRSRPSKVLVSVSSRTENLTSKSRRGLVELWKGLGLVSVSYPKVSFTSLERTERGCIHDKKKGAKNRALRNAAKHVWREEKLLSHFTRKGRQDR